MWDSRHPAFAFAPLAWLSIMTAGMLALAGAPQDQPPDDRGVVPPDLWLYDLAAARAKAVKESKPLFVVFRCTP